MKAARLHEYGPPENLKIEDIPEPTLQTPTDVRVAVHAASINPLDWKMRSGAQRGALRVSLPFTGGLDVSGEVLEVGPGVTRFSVGDLVYGCPDWRRDGSYAEQVVLDESLLAAKPASIRHLQAASLPLVGLTAWQCLLPKLTDTDNARVLIQAGSGGVGTFALQLAKHHGATVITTCSPRNNELVRSLGADEVIDYRTQNWWEEVSDIDLVLEAVGTEDRDRALTVVKKGGRVASINSGLPGNTAKYGPNCGVLATGLGLANFWLKGKLNGVDASTVVKRTRADQLEAIAKLVEEGVIKPVVDRVFPLEQIADAHVYGETGRIRGKVVIQIRA